MYDIENLAALMDKHTHQDGVLPTAIPRVFLIRASHPTTPLHVLHAPAVCIIAQGEKQVMLADRIYRYDRSRYLTVSVDLPVVGQIISATAERPYLCFRIDLDPMLLSEIMIAAGHMENEERGAATSGLFLNDATPDLIEAAIRLIRLLDSPRDIAMLSPLIERELLYRLLVGPQGGQLRQIAYGESRLRQVNAAIGWIRRNFDKPLRIEDMAEQARMSTSSFHQHFKDVTAMSPLQYQKQLRLQEARRLILGQALDAATAAHTVGYESPSQFSREYARLFGAPPLRDIARLKASPDYLLQA
ncbi:AraC family transcriptional regulator [Rhizobium herbae]|uniref:AraC family transcriptional regulator n=1 Tax=Rhizobium herbae TaxID=508661 RepID=A0ABS7HF42_9HYPH|nr:AraC family transcriptional regulator [Rhizobium herbae]MBW9065420.1 AraC family transcriptional regulator [Rhizobium herbae]